AEQQHREDQRPIEADEHRLDPLQQRGLVEHRVHLRSATRASGFDAGAAAAGASAAAAPLTVLPGSATSATARGLPIGAVDVPARVATMSSSLGYWPCSIKSNTRRAIGAAAPAPKPAFSTTSATAMRGSFSGANAV